MDREVNDGNFEVEEPVSSGSIPQSVKQTLGGAMRYLTARWKLFTMESGEIFSAYLTKIILLAACVMMLISAWFLLLLALAAYLGQLFDNLALGALAAAGVMILLAAIAFFISKRATKSSEFFKETKSEFNRDQQWLATPTTANKL